MSIDREILTNLERLINALPEVYQSIYLDGQLIREGVRKNDFERLEVIKDYIKPGQTILDVGSNVGFFTINLAKLFPENIFVSVEKQYPYARLQQELIKLEGVNNVILIHSEVSTEWLTKAIESCTYFDVALLLSVLHHIPDAENFLTKLSQISKSFIMELPHPDESRVCGKDILKKQLSFEKISKTKPVFVKMDYEATTHCDTDLKRSFYYADTPNYERNSIYPYIGYPLAPRSYTLKSTDDGLIINKAHLNQDIKAIPGVLFSDIAKIGQVFIPSYQNCIEQIEKEFSRIEKLHNVADIRPWNILFTAQGLQFIDYQYTNDLDNHLKFDKNRDYKIIKSYFNTLFRVRLKPQILIDGVFFQLYKTGIARVWKSLLEQWANTDFANHILVLDRQNTAPKINGIRYRTIQPYDYNNTEGDRQLLQQICDEEGAELFISSYYTTPIDTPSVFMAYDMIPEVMGGDLNSPMWREKHKGINHASAFIAISENTAIDINKYFPEIPLSSITVAHCGVNPLFSPASPQEIANFKYKYGIQKPYFLLGALGGYKNSILFMQAFAQLANKTGFDIMATGAGVLLPPEWRQLTAGCTFHGLQLTDEELRIAYSGAVALVYPSKYEGFGMPVIEAMACGCPVITTPNASLPEVGGDAVIYVNDDDIEGMADALCEVQKPSLRRRLIAAGLQQSQKFSWSKMAEIVKDALFNAILPPVKLGDLNYIIFPNWEIEEDDLMLGLNNIIKGLVNPPQLPLEMGEKTTENPPYQGGIKGGSKVTLVIDTTGINEEDAELLVSGVAMNLMLEEEIDISEALEISFVKELSENQWSQLLPKINARIATEFDNLETINAVNADSLLTLTLTGNNYLMFPNWQTDEETLGLELMAKIKDLAMENEGNLTCLLIDYTGFNLEDANLLLSSVVMNLMLEEEMDISESINISFLGNYSEAQWQKLTPFIKEKITLVNENLPENLLI